MPSYLQEGCIGTAGKEQASWANAGPPTRDTLGVPLTAVSTHTLAREVPHCHFPGSPGAGMPIVVTLSALGRMVSTPLAKWVDCRWLAGGVVSVLEGCWAHQCCGDYSQLVSAAPQPCCPSAEGLPICVGTAASLCSPLSAAWAGGCSLLPPNPCWA